MTNENEWEEMLTEWMQRLEIIDPIKSHRKLTMRTYGELKDIIRFYINQERKSSQKSSTINEKDANGIEVSPTQTHLSTEQKTSVRGADSRSNKQWGDMHTQNKEVYVWECPICKKAITSLSKKQQNTNIVHHKEKHQK